MPLAITVLTKEKKNSHNSLKQSTKCLINQNSFTHFHKGVEKDKTLTCPGCQLLETEINCPGTHAETDEGYRSLTLTGKQERKGHHKHKLQNIIELHQKLILSPTARADGFIALT